jgi:hypothetical protein
LKQIPVLKVPESVLYDKGYNRCFISNINGKTTEKDEDAFISTMDKQGKIINPEWATGLNTPKGMNSKITNFMLPILTGLQ